MIAAVSSFACASETTLGQGTGSAEAARDFSIPTGEAKVTLRRFSEQADLELLYSSEAVADVITRPVAGRLSPPEALQQLLRDTPLRAQRHPQTGGYAITRHRSTDRDSAPSSAPARPPAPPLSEPTNTSMKKKSPLAVFRALLGLAFAVPIAQAADGSAAPTPGTISGQISNEATGAYLEGARVGVADSDRFVLTDRQGRYSLSLPPADYTITASYTGLDPQRAMVALAPGQVVVRNFPLTAEIYKLSAFTVEGRREGNALAVTLQKEAPNVKNVVASDTFGNMADGNVGEFLQRLPGIVGNFVGDDLRTVSVRGISADLNSVTMDGDRIASSQSAGLGRAFEFEQASLGLIESIEVTKAATPDMPADSVGGNVNMVTKSAFDRADPKYFSFTVGAVWRPTKYKSVSDHWTKEPIEGIGPSLNFTYANVVGAKKNLGILVTGTWHSQPGSKNRAALMNYQNTLDQPAYVYRTVLPRLNGAPRTRLATGVKLDYKLGPNSILTLNSVYNWFHENSDTRTLTLATAQSVATLNAAGVPTGTGRIMPGYTETMTEVIAAANSTSAFSITTVDKSGATVQLTPSVTHRFDRLQIDYGASWSESRTYYDNHDSGRKYDGSPKGTISASLANVGWKVDRSRSLEWPTITQTAGPDIYDLGNYRSLLLTQPNRTGMDRNISARFNINRQFTVPVPASIKAGLSYRREDRDIAYDSRRYTYLGGAAISQFLEQPGKWAPKAQGDYRQPPWMDPYLIAKDPALHPQVWQEDINFKVTQALQNKRNVTEVIRAGYVMGRARVGHLGILAGLRVEETQTEGEGPLTELTPQERLRRAAWVGPLTDAETIRRANAQYGGRVTSEGDYRNVFPSVHFKYDTRMGVTARLSYSNGIGRPPFGSIIPEINADYDARTLRINDPSLKPQYADNFDFTLEYYFEPVGLFSAGVFLKEISNFIYQDQSRYVGPGQANGYDGQYEGFNIITSANGGSARYRGIELNYQQQFTFLPGLWRGFGLGMNYTQVETKGDYGAGAATTQVAGFIPKTGNVMLNYNGGRWTVSLQGNWRGRHLVSVASSAAQLLYENPKTTISLRTKYTLSKKLSLFCDIDNVFNALAFSRYYAYTSRPAETQRTAPKVVAGVQGRY